MFSPEEIEGSFPMQCMPVPVPVQVLDRTSDLIPNGSWCLRNLSEQQFLDADIGNSSKLVWRTEATGAGNSGIAASNRSRQDSHRKQAFPQLIRLSQNIVPGSYLSGGRVAHLVNVTFLLWAYVGWKTWLDSFLAIKWNLSVRWP
jgi:hypothetical protein